jgi:hypothetical protein
MAGRQRATRRIVACGTMARERYDAALNFSLKGKKFRRRCAAQALISHPFRADIVMLDCKAAGSTCILVPYRAGGRDA